MACCCEAECQTRSEPWVTGSLETPSGPVPVVSTRLGMRDIAGSWRARWGLRRNRYLVRPGLYAIGAPAPASPVLVTANYKQSFDAVRRELSRLDAWVLVLDTRGVNVWCAAGKGTFGTEELVRRIAATGLEAVVSHRRLILPQLGASGVSAHEVQRRSGFQVSYGPVRAADIPAYLASGLRKTAGMRTVEFGLRSRLTVVPVEVVHVLPYAAGVLVLAAILTIIRSGSVDLAGTARLSLPVLGAMAIGTVLVPLLLPVLPGRPFSLKGAALGLLWALGVGLSYGLALPGMLGVLMLLPAIAGFLAMSFTGSTTFTSLSGVKAEVSVATPLIIGAAAAGLVLYIVAALTGGIA